MKRVLVLIAAWALPWSAAAAQEASHFTYTGALRIGGEVVAETDHVPLRSVRFIDGNHVDVSVQHPGLRLEARADRDGLQYHVHAWTEARAQGFVAYVAPETLVDVGEDSTATQVIFTHAQLGEVTLHHARALPTWLQDHIDDEASLYTHCEATTLYARASEASESLPTDLGQALYVQPTRGDWQETWTRIETHWVRGFTRDARCVTERVAASAFAGVEGVRSGFSEPAHVLLPRGLRLVSPAHPHRIVMRVIAPVDAFLWAPGWTAANNEGALTIVFACGVGTWTGYLTLATNQWMPQGAPPRTR